MIVIVCDSDSDTHKMIVIVLVTQRWKCHAKLKPLNESLRKVLLLLEGALEHLDTSSFTILIE